MLGAVAGVRSLTLRVLGLLSLALLPLGAISVWQTNLLAGQADAESRMALLLLTERRATPLQAVAQRGLGIARGLSTALAEVIDDPEACSTVLATFVDRAPIYSFAGVTGLDGQLDCSSNGSVSDLSGTPSFERLVAEPRTTLTINPDGPFSGMPVVVITDPIRSTDGGVIGFLSLSVPKTELIPVEREMGQAPLTFATFNAFGELLTSTLPEDGSEAAFPVDVDLSSLVDRPAEVFLGDTSTGEERAFAVVALVPGVAYAMTSWPRAALAGSGPQRLVSTSVLPLLMWLASLLVAFVALDRLVMRHIRGLSRQMRTFARTRRLIAQPVLSSQGAELAEIEADFREMAQSILQDEAQLEDNLHEKNILLKEVYHRVKNNLQLITSIMNMQMRKTASPETRDTLRRLQERVMSLASVHRSLYRGDDMNRIDASTLVEEVSRQLVAMSPRHRHIRLDIATAPVMLVPDQAVPLSMLCSEAITNALRFAGAAEDGITTIQLELRQLDDGRGWLAISSPLGDANVVQDVEGGGLGAQLIQAFESQLGGSLTMGVHGSDYRVQIDFPVQAFLADAMDY